MTTDDNQDQIILESLLSRGFIVQKHNLLGVRGEKEGDEYENHQLFNTILNTTADKEKKEKKNDNKFYVCGQFACLSLLEGIVYGIQVNSSIVMEDSVSMTKVLAAVSSHPHIVSYFSNWTDGHFHYIQTELYCTNLSILLDHNRGIGRVVDYWTVLEHVACALHYLHDEKKYTHNNVDRWNIYSMTDTHDRIVYKLGGFHGASKLLAEDGCLTIATNTDIKSLCSTVTWLIKESDYYGNKDFDNNDVQSLHSHMLYIIEKIDSMTFIGNLPSENLDINAFNVWRWCCRTRNQQRHRQHQSLEALVYGNEATDCTEGSVEQIETTKSLDTDVKATMPSNEYISLTEKMRRL